MRVGWRIVFSSSEDLTRASRAKVAEPAFVSWVSAAAESLFATLFPADCRLCGAPLVKISRLPVCEDCLTAVKPVEGIVCAKCGERLAIQSHLPEGGGLLCCSDCRQEPPVFAKALAYGSYSGGLRDLIHLLKYQQVKPAAAVLGRMLAEVIEELAPSLDGIVPVIVPVPLHPSKLRQRGFNQSEMIAAAAAKLKPGGLELAIRAHLLERRRPTGSQTGLSEHQRQENMRGAFSLSRPDEVDGCDVLLVDDVFTTGATVSECARVLRRAGVPRVWVATVARTMKTEVVHAVLRAEPDEEMQSMAAHG